jgi:uncharacterized membrane protein YoaK (UPF0700 family)
MAKTRSPARARSVLARHPDNSRVVLFVALTFVTGSVDAVSYLGLNRVFTANMTGNVALLGFAAAGAPGLALLRSGLALLAFVVGAVVAGRVMRSADRDTTWPRHLTWALTAAALVLLAVFATWVGRDHVPQAELAAVGLAFAMGMQGAATRKLNVADLPTTVVTSTLTGLAADSPLAGGNGIRWRRRGAALVSLIVGAVVGALLVQVSPPLGLIPAMAMQLSVAGVVTAAGLHDVPAPSG